MDHSLNSLLALSKNVLHYWLRTSLRFFDCFMHYTATSAKVSLLVSNFLKGLDNNINLAPFQKQVFERRKQLFSYPSNPTPISQCSSSFIFIVLLFLFYLYSDVNKYYLT